MWVIRPSLTSESNLILPFFSSSLDWRCCTVQMLKMHHSGLTDQALAAIAKGCQQLSYLSMQGPPFLHRNTTSHLQQAGQHHQPQQQQQQHHQQSAQHAPAAQDTVTDAGLQAIAQHCKQLKALSITRERPPPLWLLERMFVSVYLP